MGEKKGISIIPHIQDGIYYDNDLEIKTELDLKSTVDLIQLALTKSKDPKNIEQSKVPPLAEKKLKVRVFPAGKNLTDVEVISDFKLDPTLYLLRQAYHNAITLLLQNTFYRRNNS